MNYPMRSDIPPVPEQMANLPVDKRGYPVPWFVKWINGEPEFRVMDEMHYWQAVQKNLCWVCGNPLWRERVFTIGPMCAINRISSEPPSHRECARYAAQACPFLSKPHMTRREGGFEEEKTNVGGVMLERNPGVTLLWFTNRYEHIRTPKNKVSDAGFLFRLGRAFKTEWYSKGRAATREEVQAALESGIPLIREVAEKNDGPEGVMLLENQITEAYRLVPR